MPRLDDSGGELTLPANPFAMKKCEVHHWLIESPQPGRDLTPGKCRKCGAERTWDKRATDYSRMDWVAIRRTAPGGYSEKH